jgi:hypothetical protein
MFLTAYLYTSHFSHYFSSFPIFSYLNLRCFAGSYSTSVSVNVHPTPPPGTLQLLREKEKERQKEKEREERERARALQHLLNGQSDNNLTEYIEEDYADTEKVKRHF